jgi:hypothetical protein
MTELESLQSSLIALALSTVILSALIALVLQVSAEFGLRAVVNRAALTFWLMRRRKWIRSARTESAHDLLRYLNFLSLYQRPLWPFGLDSASVLSMPYPQLCTVLVQAIPAALESPHPPEALAILTASSPEEFDRDFRDLYWLKSINLERGAGPPPKTDDGKRQIADDHERQIAFVKQRLISNASRALDDLQAKMGGYVAKAEYLLSFAVVGALVLMIRSGEGARSADNSFNGSILVLALGVAFLSPIFQRILDRTIYIR